MRDKLAERYYRDARITNIYEGTTQLQIVAAIAGVVKRALNPVYDELAALPYTGKLAELAAQFAAARKQVGEAVAKIESVKDNPRFFDQMAFSAVRMETIAFIGYLLCRDALDAPERMPLVEEFKSEYLPEFAMHFQYVMNGEVPNSAVLEM